MPKSPLIIIQRSFLAIGLIGLGASAYMTWKFGSSITTVHGVGLVLVTAFAALIFPAKRLLEELGAGRALLNTLFAVGIFAVGLEFIGDLGYTFGMRDKQMVESGAQKVSWKAAQKSVTDDESLLAAETTRLEKMKLAFPWAPTVSAEAERKKVDVLQKEIDLEAARGGCKEKCAKRMAEKASVEERIAYAESMNGAAKRIIDLQTSVDHKRREAASTNVGHSTVVAQTSSLAKGFLLISSLGSKDSLNPDEVEMTIADMVIGFMMAAGATFLPPMAMLIAVFGIATSAREIVRPSPLQAARRETDDMTSRAHTAGFRAVMPSRAKDSTNVFIGDGKDSEARAQLEAMKAVLRQAFAPARAAA